MAGAQAGVFPGHPRARGVGSIGARQHVELGRGDGRGERADPPRDRDELRHRRDGPVQPRQRDDRPRLRPAVAESARRLRAGRDLHGLAWATTTPTTTSPSPRTRSAARGSRCTCRKASKPTDSVVSVFYGCRSTTFCLGLAREVLARARARHAGRHRAPTRRPCLLLDPITARQFIDRGGFVKKAKLIRWVHETATMPAGPLLGSAARAELHLSLGDVRPRARGDDAQGRRGRTDPHLPGAEHQRRRGRRRNQRLLAHHGRRTTASRSRSTTGANAACRVRLR